MKHAIVAVLALMLGAGVAYVALQKSPPPAPKSVSTPPVNDAGPAAGDSAGATAPSGLLHEGNPDAAAARPKCATHGIPDELCAFCHPELEQTLGFCRGHDVAEAFCTRCSPILIAAFKIEGDWCQEHGLPESQCKLCNAGSAPAGPSSP